MRTTLTLEDEVILGIKRIQNRRPGASFKQVVNQLLRKGLLAEGEARPATKRFKVRTFDAVPRAGLNFDNAQELLSIIEGDARKW